MLVELSQDTSSFTSSGSVLVRGPSCLPLVLHLLSVSAHAVSAAVLPLPLLPTAEHNMAQHGTTTASGRALCQLRCPWAASHEDITRTQHALVGRDVIVAHETTAHHQLPGYLP